AKDKDELSPGLRVPADTPPILLAHANDDRESYGGSNAEHSAFMYIALKRAGVPVELHIYATGDHDFGVRQNEKLPSSWPQLCLNWLRSRDLYTPCAQEVKGAFLKQLDRPRIPLDVQTRKTETDAGDNVAEYINIASE